MPPKLQAEFRDGEWFVSASDSNGWFGYGRDKSLLNALADIEQARIETLECNFPALGRIFRRPRHA